MNATTVAVLDRLTDPKIVALAELRTALDDLMDEIVGLKTAAGKDGSDMTDYLVFLCTEVDDAYDDLKRRIS